MLRVSIYSFYASLFLLLGACASAPLAQKQISSERVYFKPYDDVWRAIHGVIHYPIIIENFDAGIIETEPLAVSEGWRSPLTKVPDSLGVKFKLVFRVTKGAIEKTPSTKVTIDKLITRQRDFISDPEYIESDKHEELSLLYRIERELQILTALKQSGLTE